MSRPVKIEFGFLAGFVAIFAVMTVVEIKKQVEELNHNLIGIRQVMERQYDLDLQQSRQPKE